MDLLILFFFFPYEAETSHSKSLICTNVYFILLETLLKFEASKMSVKMLSHDYVLNLSLFASTIHVAEEFKLKRSP